MRYVDIFNGDADGLIARHQYRLAFPVSNGQLRLITGVKRDIALVGQLDASLVDEVTVFDISYDQNAAAVEHLLAQGVHVRYFDHHRADKLKMHALLDAHIDLSPTTCTSLLVDQFLGGAYRAWAITAAFGDNLITVATQLACEQALSAAEAAALRELGECLNYNAYGEREEDLYFRPAELAARLAPYANPLAFMQADNAFATLKRGVIEDLQRAIAVAPHYVSTACAIFILPDAAWARRVSGAFANRVAEAHPARAHAILTQKQAGDFTVSIRAPVAAAHSADRVALAFVGGGGRASAAGINQLASDEIATLIVKMDAAFGSITTPISAPHEPSRESS